MSKRRTWSTTHSKDGNEVVLYEYNFKARVVNVLFNIYDALDGKVTRHALCGGQDWLHKIPLGKPRYCPEPAFSDVLENSLGSWLYRRTNDVVSWWMKHTSPCEVASVAIDKETAVKLWPDMSWLILDDDDDDDDDVDEEN